MKNTTRSLSCLSAFLLLGASSTWAAPLTQAELTRVYNEVSMVDPGAGKRPAAVHDVVKGNLAVETGLESRAELLFPDNTLTRLASNTYFSFKTGTREMDLGRGAILFQIPKGVGGAKINTAAITAAITGTTGFVEQVGKTFKLVLLEGTVRVYLRDRMRESMIVHGGQMLIAPTNARTMKDWSTVDVDVSKMMKTSTLLKPELFKPLPPAAMNLITEVITAQGGKIAGGELNRTNLVIAGGVSTVLLVDNAARNAFGDPPPKKKSPSAPSPSPTATPNPTATPSPTATPLPTPDSNPTPNPNPTPNGTPPPPPSGYITDNTTVIATNNVGPTITTQGVTTPGVIYKDLMTNGSPSAFLFGATSVFDNSLNFDSNYGHDLGTNAVFVFDSLQLGGLTFNTQNGPGSVTLVGNVGITNSPGTTIDLGGINNLLFATQAGNITLDSGISFMTTRGDHPSFVEFYARGGDLTTGSTFNLPNSDLQFASENNADFTAPAAVTARNLNVTGLQSVQFDGGANVAQVFQLDGGTVEMGGTVTAKNAFLYGSSATINGSLNNQGLTAAVTGDFVLNPGGSLISSSGDANTSITTGGNLTLNGTVSTHKLSLTAAGALALGGTITASDQLTATSATASVNGTLNLKGASFQTSGDFVIGGTGAITDAKDTIINANGGGITVDGAATAQDLTFTATNGITVNGALTANQTISPLGIASGGSVSLTAAGNIAINQAMHATKVGITGKSIDFGTDLALAGSQNELTATNGGINATGHQLSGFDNVSLTNGDFTAGGLSANMLTLNQSGNVSVTNDLILARSLVGPGSVTVGGLFAAPTITAGNVTTNALHTNNLTSSGILSLGSSDLAVFSGGGLSLTAAGMAFGANVSLSGVNADLTATNGNIDATNHQLNGFDQVSVSNGNFTADGLLANTLIVNQAGSVNVANNLNLKNPFSGLGAVTVGGLLTTPTITAGNISVNALKTNTVTSSGTFTLGSSSLTPFNNSTVTITAPTVSLLAGASMDGQAGTPTTNPGNGLNLTINTGTFTLGAGLSLDGGDSDATRIGPGGSGGTLNITSSDSITVNAPIDATTGRNGKNTSIGGNGGTVNLTAANTLALNNKIQVSSSTGTNRSNRGGKISVTSNKLSGTAITVGSSAQLLALLNSAVPGGGGGGSITFVSAGGDINVNGATMQADRGTIDIHNNGATGIVAIDNATLNASTIKAGALGNNGTLNVGGGTMSADSIIHLYAGGSNGTVNFTSNVTLGGNSLKTIAANTVTIFDGVKVTINGNSAANVFTNNPNYTGFGGNGSTTGTFGGKGAVTQPLSAVHGGY